MSVSVNVKNGLPLPPPELRMNGREQRDDNEYNRTAAGLARFTNNILRVDNFNQFRRGIREIGGMKVVDLGCGTARFLHGLVLSDLTPCNYTGIDVQKEQIDWCRNTLTSYGSYTFQRVDVQNDRYNPSGTSAIHNQISSLQSDCDLIMARSVFTHMRTFEAYETLQEMRAAISNVGRAILTVNVDTFAIPWTDRPDGRKDPNDLLKVQFNKVYFENMIDECRFKISLFVENYGGQSVYLLRPF